MRETLNFVVI